MLDGEAVELLVNSFAGIIVVGAVLNGDNSAIWAVGKGIRRKRHHPQEIALHKRGDQEQRVVVSETSPILPLVGSFRKDLFLSVSVHFWAVPLKRLLVRCHCQSP